MSCNADIMTETRHNVVAVPLPAVTVRTDMPTDKNPDLAEGGRGPRLEKEKNNEIAKRPPSVVFLYKNGKAELVSVETGISDNGFIEITSGLDSGDEVISGSFMAVSRTLKDGMAVKIDTVSKKFKSR